MKPTLIITVDTEEDGAWSGRYPATGHTVANVREIPRFQRLCDTYGIRPTYFVDAPVVQDDFSVALLKEIQDSGRAEIGAHLHPWCNPPLNGDSDPHQSFMCNLPEPVQREKLVWLTDAIHQRFGRRPTSFRAGRYGLDIAGARILRDLGYLVDSSVIPFTDYSSEGGPDFGSAPHTPYYIDFGAEKEDRNLLCMAPEGPFRQKVPVPFSCSLLEVPVSVGFSRPGFARAHRLLRAAQRPWLRRFRSVGILDRLNVARRIKLSPEQSDVPRMKQLVDAYLAQGAPAMVLMFHSTSLLPGLSPYVKTEDDLKAFYRRVDETFAYCLREQAMATATVTAFAEDFSAKSGLR
jgi:hypothetical protein